MECSLIQITTFRMELDDALHVNLHRPPTSYFLEMMSYIQQ